MYYVSHTCTSSFFLNLPQPLAGNFLSVPVIISSKALNLFSKPLYWYQCARQTHGMHMKTRDHAWSRFKKVLYTWLSIFLCQLPSTILRSTAFLKALNGSSSDFRLSIYFCKKLAKAWFWMFKKKLTCLGKGSPAPPLKKTKETNLGQLT